MLWGKKVVEWSATPAAAYDTLVRLNNKYALDGRDPNSWTGILWCFGLFDRPWTERRVLGTVRYIRPRTPRASSSSGPTSTMSPPSRPSPMSAPPAHRPGRTTLHERVDAPHEVVQLETELTPGHARVAHGCPLMLSRRPYENRLRAAEGPIVPTRAHGVDGPAFSVSRVDGRRRRHRGNGGGGQ